MRAITSNLIRKEQVPHKSRLKRLVQIEEKFERGDGTNKLLKLCELGSNTEWCHRAGLAQGSVKKACMTAELMVAWFCFMVYEAK